ISALAAQGGVGRDLYFEVEVARALRGSIALTREAQFVFLGHAGRDSHQNRMRFAAMTQPTAGRARRRPCAAPPLTHLAAHREEAPGRQLGPAAPTTSGALMVGGARRAARAQARAALVLLPYLDAPLGAVRGLEERELERDREVGLDRAIE